MLSFLLILQLFLISPIIEDTPERQYKELNKFIRSCNSASPKANFRKWEKIKNLPQPYIEIAAEKLLSLELSQNKRKSVLKIFPFCREILIKKKYTNKLANWLKKKDCITSSKIKITTACHLLASPAGKAFILETLWRVFPGHPLAVSWLIDAIDISKKFDLKNTKKLETFLFNFHPESMKKEDLSFRIKATPCSKRKNLINTIFNRGVYSLIPLYIKGCNFPVLSARLEYFSGNYKKALEILTNLPEKDIPKGLLARIKIQVNSPFGIAEKHRILWEKSKSLKELRRAVKTYFLAEKYEHIFRILNNIKSKTIKLGTYLNWAKGYAAFKIGKRAVAKNIWLKDLHLRSGRGRARLIYWLNRVQNKQYDAKISKKKPIQAFYSRMLRSKYNRGRSWPSLLPVFFSVKKPGRYILKRAISDVKNNSDLRFGLSLLLENLSDSATECLYNGLAITSRKNRRVLKTLWQCWELPEGNPYKCKIINKTKIEPELKREDQSQIALYLNWPHLAPVWGTFLPRPYEKTIIKMARIYKIPVSLLYAIMLSESHYEPFIVSPADALGFFQVIPPTGVEIGKFIGEPDFSASMLFNEATAIRYGAAYLSILSKTFNRNWPLVVAGYNAGPHQVKRWLKRKMKIPMDEWIEEIPFGETRAYVKLVLGRWILYSREIGDEPPKWSKQL